MASPEVERLSIAVLFANADRADPPQHDDDNIIAEALSSYRGIVVEQVHRHSGRVIRAEGDTILAEIFAPVSAVECAVKIQRELARRNRELPATSQVRGRVGVTFGDAEGPEGSGSRTVSKAPLVWRPWPSGVASASRGRSMMRSDLG